MANKGINVLETCGLPIFFKVGNADEVGISAPRNRKGLAVRTWVRSLSVMQKEALVISDTTGLVWRFASDEGPYLNSFDSAPCPLAFFTTGMVSSYMNEIQALAKIQNIKIRNIKLVLDNYYSMEGSLPRGTMIGGAMPIDLDIQIEADAADSMVKKLVYDAIYTSPITGLMRESLSSVFTLSKNGKPVEVGRVAALDGPLEPDPDDRFPFVKVSGDPVVAGPLMEKLEQVATKSGVAGGAGSSLTSEQNRKLHVRGICTIREDGVKQIDQYLINPLGSQFRFLSDEAQQHGGQGKAPDAVSYISAGIGFCYMTQLGRYATILRKNLAEYRVVQDTHFSEGGATGGTGKRGEADPVETHVYLKTSEDDDFARDILDMGEQTCFLHAFCRTELEPNIKKIST
ncbi:hypothetical protein D1BOALGB6SA_2894 [Olavius sp. associated proteobacterium Delta 1]|nr:hypothetical protein D1BOALGB6SA_2894 [Olavius sp. associated proteobacterium Delta 1]